MSPQHVDPEEAVKIHEDIKAHYSVGIHWGTFKMTYEVQKIYIFSIFSFIHHNFAEVVHVTYQFSI